MRFITRALVPLEPKVVWNAISPERFHDADYYRSWLRDHVPLLREGWSGQPPREVCTDDSSDEYADQKPEDEDVGESSW